MIRKILVQSLAVFAAVALFAGSAQAAFFSLSPNGTVPIAVGSSGNFDANLTVDALDPNAFGADFHIVVEDTTIAGITAAETLGNPFLLPSLNTSPPFGLPGEISIGGADLFGAGQSGTIRLGGITVAHIAAGTTNLLDGQFSGAVDVDGNAITMTTPTILATIVPEPTTLVLLGLGVSGLAFLRRRSA